MFRGFFDDSFMDEVKGFIDYLEDIFEGFSDLVENPNGKAECQTKPNGDPESHEHSHTYRKEETRVDGELVEQREEEWKDGEKVKDEHYTKCLDGKKDEKKKICGCGDNGCKREDVEYTIEFDDEDAADAPDERAESKSDVLRKCVNSLCEGAEKDHKRIAELEQENSMLRIQLSDSDKKFRQREADLLSEISELQEQIKRKDDLIGAFQHLTDAVKTHENCKNVKAY